MTESPTRHESVPTGAPDGWIRLRTTGLVALAVIVADQLTKALVLRSIGPTERLHVFGPVSLIRRFNTGAAFSFGDGSGIMAWVATTMIVVVIVVIVRHLRSPSVGSPLVSDRRWWIALGLICGGGLGNQLDRLFRAGGWNRGAVIDFVDVGFWPIFNLADSALTIGCVVLAVLSLLDNSGSRSAPASPLKHSSLQ